MYKKILVPLDESAMAEAVLPHVQSLAKAFDAEIVLVFIDEQLPARAMYVPEAVDVTALQQVSVEARATANHYVHQRAELLMEKGYKARAEVIEGSSISDAIIQYAAQNNVDLVAMSTHGRSGVARLFLGSVADKVVRDAKIPILLIRPDES